MQQSFNREELNNMAYLVGSADVIFGMQTVSARKPFDDEIIDFLNDVSRTLMTDREAKAYPDVVTLAFWMRKSSVMKLRERFVQGTGEVYLGRGMAFHIAPSNVPVNYAYSLVTGLLTGNANVVRIPSKDFPQVNIINRAIKDVLEKYEDVKPYICLVRYGRSQGMNDLLSLIADTRIIWGGDATIAEIRKSPLAPRAGEITFADRFSLAVIDSESYLARGDKEKIAEGFYNDTYLTDQNACTSPRIIVWMGKEKKQAKQEFWSWLHRLVQKKYNFQAVQGINKLTSSYLLAVKQSGVKIAPHTDNLIIRTEIPEIPDGLMELKDNSGYFFEYDCEDILELRELCNDKHCQTVAYIGNKDMLIPLIESGVKGIDRIVPVGKTMDFDFIWDGYNLFERLTRIVKLDV